MPQGRPRTAVERRAVIAKERDTEEKSPINVSGTKKPVNKDY